MEKYFDKAATDIKTHGKNLTNDQLLKIYSLYKQGTIGDCNTSRPWAIDMKGTAKWDAWNALKGKSQNDAKKEYVETVLQFLPEDVKKDYV